MSFRDRLARLLVSPRAPWIAAGVAVVLSLPSLAGGFAADDQAMVMALESGASSWDVFDISQYGTVPQWRESGSMGWWAADDLRIAFLRPISSITHWIDCRLWPRSPWAMHLVNVLIYGIVVPLAGLLFRSIRDGEGRRSSTAALPEREVVVIVDVPLELILLFPQKIREHRGGRWPAHVNPLYAGLEPLEIERVDERALELRSRRGWLASPLDRVARSLDRPFQAGDHVELTAMEVEVLEVSDDGRPTRARFTFDRSLDQIGWVGWSEDGPGPWDPPAVGQQVGLTAKITM